MPVSYPIIRKNICLYYYGIPTLITIAFLLFFKVIILLAAPK